MYHVIASDLDGTLLSSDHVISFHTKETLKLLSKRNVYFIFATGRHHVDVARMRDYLKIDAFMITSNGARVHNSNKELIFSYDIDEDIVIYLYHVVHNVTDITTNVYRHDDWFVNHDYADQNIFFKESYFQHKTFEPKMLGTSGVYKVYFTCHDYKKLLLLENTINARWGTRVNVSFSFPTCLEVMAGGVSKGIALDKVVKIIGYTLKECIAFGDGMNDLEMLSIVGKGCIMSSAHQRLKDQLPNLEIIESNIDDAVSRYLRKIFLL
ncbi:Pyridoxal phosphate phosphatase YigL [Candidatus Ecksteinia adelgidicola]|nr:Pyridoxal phosphate phosphatase YigL [Candidatus Ecksteinia adelgidicola]